MYKYETHCHCLPVSHCAKVGIEEMVDFYKKAGYDGIFLTNHFIDGNIGCDKTLPYQDKIAFYCQDFHRAKEYGDKIGIKVFFAFESTTIRGTDFLVYGLSEKWLYDHPEIENMDKKEELAYFKEHGALIIQAHPFREKHYIDHIRLYPRSVDGIEIINTGNTHFENRMAKIYADEYGLIQIAGSDNHFGQKIETLGGIKTKIPLESVEDFIKTIKNGQFELFVEKNNLKKE